MRMQMMLSVICSELLWLWWSLIYFWSCFSLFCSSQSCMRISARLVWPGVLISWGKCCHFQLPFPVAAGRCLLHIGFRSAPCGWSIRPQLSCPSHHSTIQKSSALQPPVQTPRTFRNYTTAPWAWTYFILIFLIQFMIWRADGFKEMPKSLSVAFVPPKLMYLIHLFSLLAPVKSFPVPSSFAFCQCCIALVGLQVVLQYRM